MCVYIYIHIYFFWGGEGGLGKPTKQYTRTLVQGSYGFTDLFGAMLRAPLRGT